MVAVDEDCMDADILNWHRKRVLMFEKLGDERTYIQAKKSCLLCLQH